MFKAKYFSLEGYKPISVKETENKRFEGTQTIAIYNFYPMVGLGFYKR